MHVSSDFWQITNIYIDNINGCSLVISLLNAMDSVQRLFLYSWPRFRKLRVILYKIMARLSHTLYMTWQLNWCCAPVCRMVIHWIIEIRNWAHRKTKIWIMSSDIFRDGSTKSRVVNCVALDLINLSKFLKNNVQANNYLSTCAQRKCKYYGVNCQYS